jgi:hypothetical protein
MIVIILEGEDNRMLQQADLALRKTDMKTVTGQRLYEVVKSRHGPTGRYVAEIDIRDFVRDYERKEQERKNGQSEVRQSQHRPKEPPRKTV